MMGLTGIATSFRVVAGGPEDIGEGFNGQRGILAIDFEDQLGPFQGDKENQIERAFAIGGFLTVADRDTRLESPGRLGEQSCRSHMQSHGIADRDSSADRSVAGHGAFILLSGS